MVKDFNDDNFNIGYDYLKNIFQKLDISSALNEKKYSKNIEYSISKAYKL